MYLHTKQKQLEQPLGCSHRDGRAGVASAAGRPEPPTRLPQEKQGTVLERREHRNGVLQLEGRAYRRKKDGELTERGALLVFLYREGGKQRTLYIGKTDNPEVKANEIMEREGDD
jgi:hypothetical protein